MVNYKRIAVTFISFIITILLFIYLFDVRDIEKIKNSLLSIEASHFILYAFFSLSNAFFRALRYKFLLIPIEVPISSMFGVTLLRNLFVDMFPAKLGALSYPAILNQRYKVPIDSCLSSFFYSFLFDVITLPPFLLFSLLLIGEVHFYTPKVIFIIGSLVIIFVTTIIIVYMDRALRFANIILYCIIDKLKLSNKKFFQKIRIKLADTVQAVEYLKAKGSIILIFFLSLLIRLFKYLGLYFLFSSICKFEELISFKHFAQLIFGITAADFTAIFPFQFFGGYGTWETAWTLILQLFDYKKLDAAIVGLTVHAYSQMWEYFVGFLAFCIVILPYILKKSR